MPFGKFSFIRLNSYRRGDEHTQCLSNICRCGRLTLTPLQVSLSCPKLGTKHWIAIFEKYKPEFLFNCRGLTPASN